MQLAFAKFLSKLKENFLYSASIMDTALPQKFPFILDRNLAKANCTENRVCMPCDTVVLVKSTNLVLSYSEENRKNANYSEIYEIIQIYAHVK